MEKTSAPSLKENITLTRRDILDFSLQAMGFFMGRANLFGTVNPFGIAYICPWLFTGNKFYLSAVFTGLGFLSKFNPLYSPKYIICLVILFLCNVLIRYKNNGPPAKLQGIFAGSAMLVSGAAFTYFSYGGVYSAVISVLEGGLTLALGMVISSGADCLAAPKRRSSLSGEEVLSLAVIGAGIAAGAADIHLGWLSCRYFFCGLITLLAAKSGGGGGGAATGMILGLIMSLAGYEDISFAVILSLGGLLSGGLKRYNKAFGLLGLLLGITLSAIFLDLSLINLRTVFSLGVAAAAYFLISEKLLLTLPASLYPAAAPGDEYREKVKSLAASKLRDFSAAFARLSKTLEKVSAATEESPRQKVNHLIDDAAAKICNDCQKCGECWLDNFYRTYQCVIGMMESCEQNGNFCQEDLPAEFTAFCLHSEKFAGAVSNYYEIYKVNRLWVKKMEESRETVSGQFKAVSDIFSQLERELYQELNMDPWLESRALSELIKNKVEVESIMVIQGKEGRYQVSIGRKDKERAFPEKEAGDILSRVLGRKMRRDEDEIYIVDSKKKMRRIKYVEEQRLCMTCGVARGVKTGGRESGDSYSFMELKNGKIVMALSDGMGSGAKAREESRAAVELLEDFLEAGFNEETAVNFINSGLLLKSGGEIFSTLDICSMDLQTGDAEFIKIGAASTFIIRDGNVEIIRSWNLPVGVLKEIDVETCHRKLVHGDLVVMISDGVLDASEIDGDRERWVSKALSTMNFSFPQEIADYLLAEAENKYGKIIKDDMTILVGRVWEKYK